MDIGKIREAEKSERLAVLEKEFLPQGKEGDPGAILELEMALKALKEVEFSVEPNGTIVMATVVNSVTNDGVVSKSTDGIVLKRGCPGRYNAYQFLEYYLGIGRYEPFTNYDMRVSFPDIGPASIDDLSEEEAYQDCYDQLADRILGFARNHLCDQKAIGQVVIEIQSATRIVRLAF